MSSLPSTTTTTASCGDDNIQEIIIAKRGCICFWMPCFYRSDQTTPSWWERMSSSSPENNKKKKEKWWVSGCKNVREWSEIVAGPKWKTFIRRFNKRTVSSSYSKQVSFHYDPLSYALNFDDGLNAVADAEDAYGYTRFSARFAYVPASDVGKDAPALT